MRKSPHDASTRSIFANSKQEDGTSTPGYHLQQNYLRIHSLSHFCSPCHILL
jgi:hypothetical protein